MAQISIVIPTYNRLKTLPRAIESVLKQTFTDWELWIIDDGSTDGTAGWVQGQLRPRDPRVHYLRTLNYGVSHARNRGWRIATSPWVAFLDSDDEWLPHKLEVQFERAQVSQSPIIHTEEIWIRNGIRVNSMKKHAKAGGRIFIKCLSLCCISPSTVMLHKSILKEPPFREDFPVCEDYELWLRLCSQYNVEFIEEPLIKKYGGHNDQLSRKYFAMDYWRVKAMVMHSSNPHLSHFEKQALLSEIRRKTEILMKGYKKHGNLEPLLEIHSWQQQLDIN